jgi:hypothetical protein
MTRQLLTPGNRFVQEIYSKIIPGECSCGAPCDKVIDSNRSCRRDRVRFSNDSTTAWNVFRCHRCGSVIEETWRPRVEGT